MYDLLIVGAGPAGLTAALYAARRDLKVLVVSKDLGGQAILTDKIYNYPGVMFSDGMSMMQEFKKQAAEYGAQFLFTEVTGLEKNGDEFTVKTTKEDLQAKSVILSFGLTPRDLDIEGEERFKGDSIFCAVTEHGPRFKGKDIAVIGGGNSALDSVVFLQPIANKIYLIHRRDQFRGEEITVKKIQEFKNVEFVLNSEVHSLIGENRLKGMTVKNSKSGEARQIDIDAICVNIGYRANTKWLGDLIDRDKRGHILVNRDTETKTEGLFAAGDCTDLPYKQIITSGGEGCKASMRAYEYLMKKAGKRAVMIDWN
jgi:thioredoxin reductase (NADPH)